MKTVYIIVYDYRGKVIDGDYDEIMVGDVYDTKEKALARIKEDVEYADMDRDMIMIYERDVY